MRQLRIVYLRLHTCCSFGNCRNQVNEARYHFDIWYTFVLSLHYYADRQCKVLTDKKNELLLMIFYKVGRSDLCRCHNLDPFRLRNRSSRHHLIQMFERRSVMAFMPEIRGKGTDLNHIKRLANEDSRGAPSHARYEINYLGN